jgi:hypothetical protein
MPEIPPRINDTSGVLVKKDYSGIVTAGQAGPRSTKNIFRVSFFYMWRCNRLQVTMDIPCHVFRSVGSENRGIQQEEQIKKKSGLPPRVRVR